jgi:iron complex outermembrane receptor protein
MILRYSSQFLFVLGCLALSALVCTAAFSQTPTGSEPSDLGSMSLEDLMNIEVTSVSKKPQKLSDAAAAVYVITQDEIRRSGLTSIPELLRLVPGLEVANIDSQRWAITARGFNSRYSNKLLVMIDGRSVYSPLYSGVWWDVQDLVLEDIERIEVIRGPGASLWGANAVNGIINIITRDASDTQGTSVSVSAGEQSNSFVYGGKSGTNGSFRIYAKNKAVNEFTDASGNPACDSWSQNRGGFRFDSGNAGSGMTIQADIHEGRGRIPMIENLFASPYAAPFPADVKLNGANVMGRWNRTSASGAESKLQLYYEQAYRDDVQHVETRNTYDLDFQQQMPAHGRHNLMWGLGYRYNLSDTEVTDYTRFDPAFRLFRLASAFVQDEISLQPGRKTLTIGSKLEYDQYAGFNLQPTIRMLWTPPGRGTVWAGVSRAVRNPGRGDLAGWLSFKSMPSSIPSLAQLITLNGNPDFKSENVVAYEIGYRNEPTSKFSMDVAAFYNVYDNLRTLEVGTPGLVATPVPHIEVPLIWDNKMSGTSCGLEVAANWRPRQDWKLTLGYTYLNVSTHLDPDSTATAVPEGYEYNTPCNQVSLRSYLNLPGNREFDAMLYSVDGFKHHDVPGYLRLDLRYGWRLKNGMELSLVGQNLLEDHHQEFYGVLNEENTEVPRTFYVKLTKAW